MGRSGPLTSDLAAANGLPRPSTSNHLATSGGPPETVIRLVVRNRSGHAPLMAGESFGGMRAE